MNYKTIVKTTLKTIFLLAVLAIGSLQDFSLEFELKTKKEETVAKKVYLTEQDSMIQDKADIACLK